MSNIFTKEEINFGRQRELDFAKGIAVLFMIWVHVIEVYQSTEIEGSLYNRIIEFIGSPPAAPIFMMMLGVGIVYSRKSTPKSLFNRGLILIVSGYILNFFRDFIPYYLLGKIHQDVEYIKEGWVLLWGTDILPFAGLAFIYFAFIKKFKVKNNILFMIWSLFMVLNILLKDVSFENSILNGAFRLIWGIDETSWFPFLTWISYPILGYYFAQVLIRCKDKKTFYRNIFFVAGSFSIPLWIYSYVNDVKFGAFGELYQVEYYHHDLVGTIVLCTFALFWISVCYFAYDYIPNFIREIMARWSKNTNMIYSVHWLILGYLLLVLEELAYMPFELFMIMVFVVILTDRICFIVNKIKAKKNQKEIDINSNIGTV